MMSSESVSARHEARSPVAIIWNIYGMVIAIGAFCFLLGFSVMRLAMETGGRGSIYLEHLDIATLVAAPFGLIIFAARIRQYLRRLTSAAQRMAGDGR